MSGLSTPKLVHSSSRTHTQSKLGDGGLKADILLRQGGSVNFAYGLSKNGRRSAIVIAANSGLPGGKVNYEVKNGEKLHMTHKPQEENIVSNWLKTSEMYGYKPIDMFKIIDNKWGLDDTGTNTVQGVDYTKANHVTDWNDAWVLKNAVLGEEDKNKELIRNHSFYTNLIFAAVANANKEGGKPGGTMKRTFSEFAQKDIENFATIIVEVMKTILDSAIYHKIPNLVMPLIGTGVYAGSEELKSFFKFRFYLLLQKALNDKDRGAPRSTYFDIIIIAAYSDDDYQLVANGRTQFEKERREHNVKQRGVKRKIECTDDHLKDFTDKWIKKVPWLFYRDRYIDNIVNDIKQKCEGEDSAEEHIKRMEAQRLSCAIM